MSNIVMFAAVTAILKNTLENALVQQAATTGVGDASVSTLPPDRVVTGADERPQLNLYLYRLTPDTGWKQRMRTDSLAPQQTQELALKLHYLLSVYSERDFQAEILLGVAVQCLQACTQISSARISAALDALNLRKSGHATLNALARSAASTQLEQINVIPEFLSTEEHAKIWGAFQSHARLSVAYQVSVLLNTSSVNEVQSTLRAKQ